MNREAFLAIMTSVLIVGAVLATFALAFGPGETQCRLASASEFKMIGAPVSSEGPSGESKNVTKPGSDKAIDPLDKCHQTCRIDGTQSRFMQRMCWLGCVYSTYGIPAGT